MISTKAVYCEDLENALSRVLHLERLKDCSVLITGATGLIGSFITEMLLLGNQKGMCSVQVYAAGRSKERLQNRFRSYKEDSALHLVEYDVCNEITFEDSFDYIIHAASNAYPAAFSKDPIGTIEANLIGTKRLLDYGREHGLKRFLFVSSGEVYGQMPADTPMFLENMSGYVDPLQVRSCYPLSKRLAENYCVAFARQYGIETVIVRPCHTYGANFTASDNRATVQFFNDAIAGKDIVLKSEGKPIRSYMYIADSAPAILSVLCCGENATAYNISNPASIVSIREFAEYTAKAADRKVIIELPSDKPVDDTPITRQILCSERLEQLGFCSVYSCEEGIRRSLAILKGELS